MARIQILSSQEEKAFGTAPQFSPKEQKYYFKISTEFLEYFREIKSENIAFILVQYGYFRATNTFYEEINEIDIKYIKEKTSLQNIILNIPKSTRFRYYTMIKESLGVGSLNFEIKSILENEALEMAGSFQDRRKILYTLVTLSKSLKIEIPALTVLTGIIAQALGQQKSSIIEKLKAYKKDKNLFELDIFVQKSDSFKNQYAIATFKKLEHSTARGKMIASLSLHATIKSKFFLTHSIINAIGITPQIALYYAKWIDKVRVHQLTCRDQYDTYFSLLCFVQYQYFIRNDNLIDRFISTVQSAKNSSFRAHKELTYQQAPSKNKTIDSLENINLTTINEITHITNANTMSANAKITAIKQILNKKTDELKIVLSSNSAKNSDLEAVIYDLLEKKSIELQGKLAGVLKTVEFDTHSSNAKLISAIEYFKTHEILTDKSPRGFLEKEEEKMIFEGGKFRISLYKILLFFAVSDGIKSGTLNVKYSYRYQSFDDYLIDNEIWNKSKNELIETYKMSHLKDFDSFIKHISDKLEASFKHTNERIAKNLNTNFKLTVDSFIVTTPAVEKIVENDNIGKYLPNSNYISIIDILNTINKQTHFLDVLSHYSVTNTNKASEHLLLASILGYGCNINLTKIGKISKGINSNQLDTTKTFYFTEENTMEANDKIIAFMDRLEIVKSLRNSQEINHTSSDGQKYNMKSSVDSTNAGYSFKYFGTAKGVSVYTFIDESHLLFYSTVINVSERESGHVLDGLMHNDVVQSDIHSTDTHGFSEVIFGLTHFLGFSFAPRIKNFKDQQLYSFNPRKEHLLLGHILLPKHKININKIKEYWDEILRLLVTIKSKKSTASQLLHRLTSYSKQHKLYSAIKEFGKIIKTDFLLNYIDDLELHQRIKKQLNKVESSNRFSKAVFFGNNTEFTVATVEEQNIANNCKRLIQNSVILWNYLYMSQKLNEATKIEEKEEILKTIQHSSIVHWSHTNFYGEYDFTRLNRKNSSYLKDIDFLNLGKL